MTRSSRPASNVSRDTRRRHHGQDRFARAATWFSSFRPRRSTGGLGSAYDYGHYGVLLKENVKARWLEAMVRERDDIVALDSSIILQRGCEQQVQREDPVVEAHAGQSP